MESQHSHRRKQARPERVPEHGLQLADGEQDGGDDDGSGSGQLAAAPATKVHEGAPGQPRTLPHQQRHSSGNQHHAVGQPARTEVVNSGGSGSAQTGAVQDARQQQQEEAEGEEEGKSIEELEQAAIDRLGKFVVDLGQELPAGWSVKVTMRQSGATAGRTDARYFSPAGERFRSMAEVAAALGAAHAGAATWQGRLRTPPLEEQTLRRQA
ncbi:hypothetical protein ABPG75_002195 [Micractinium tetrahymenae]